MKNTSRKREKIEGRLGRRRTYKCRSCGQKFQVDTIGPLPEKERLCLICKVENGQFINPYSPNPGLANYEYRDEH